LECIALCSCTDVSPSFLSMVGGSRSICGSGSRSISGLLGGIVGISVHDLDADLLGEGKLDSLAGGGSKSSNALLDRDTGILDLWDGDAFVLSEVSAGDSGEEDGFVDAGLDWLGVRDGDLGLDNGDNGDVVASLLGDLLAVVVSVAVISVSWGWLADGNHLGVTLLVEGDLNSLGSCGFSLLLVRVGADLIVDLLDALGTDSTGDWVALFYVNNDLDGKLNWVADSFESRGANFSSFDNIKN